VKSTGLATTPVRPDGKTNWKIIELVTNKFDATITDNNIPISDTESKSDNSDDSIEEGDEDENWKESQLAESIRATLPNTKLKPKSHNPVTFEQD